MDAFVEGLFISVCVIILIMTGLYKILSRIETHLEIASRRLEKISVDLEIIRQR